MRIIDDTCGDLYDSSQVMLFWDYTPNDGTKSVASGVTGATGKCLLLQTGLASPVYLRKNLPSTYPRLIAGLRYQIVTLPASGYVPVFSYWDGAALANTTLYVDASGRLSVWRGLLTDRGTQVGSYSAAAIVHAGNFLHLGFDLQWATSGASVTVYANSQVVMTASGITTAENAGGIGQFSVWTGSAGGGQAYVDDIYVNDTTGSYNNGFDGDIQGLVFLPSSAGRLTQQTIGGTSPAATNWQSTNQAAPDDDITYVTAATTGLIDMYHVPALPGNVTQIVCVSTVLDTKTDTSGLGAGATVRPKIGNGATEANGASVSLNTTYANKYQSWGNNPLTATAWALADWTTVQVGHERTA